jgi:hypothetical protein
VTGHAFAVAQPRHGRNAELYGRVSERQLSGDGDGARSPSNRIS